MHDGSTEICSDNAFDNAVRNPWRGKIFAANLTHQYIAGPIIVAPYILNLIIFRNQTLLNIFAPEQ